MSINPFQNESETDQISDLKIENRTDKITIYGNIDITKDREGLKNAYKLQFLLNQIVEKLLQEKLPEKIEYKPPTEIDNPFK